jgi:hypothetical protein
MDESRPDISPDAAGGAPFAEAQHQEEPTGVQNYSDYPPQDPFQADPPVPPQQQQQQPKKRSSRHMLYSVEILVFSLIGWGWLAVREYLGSTPVLDVSVLLCLLVSSLINLALSLVYHTTDQFRPAAQAFFAHALSLWALYLYGLAESTAARPSPLCCNGAASFSAPQTYAAAYFGGLPFHQAAGMVTVAFLSVLVVVSAAQVGACLGDPREWLPRDVLLAIVCLFSLHLGLFTRAAGVCGDGGLGLGVVAVAGFLLAVMLHVPEDGVRLYELARDSIRRRNNSNKVSPEGVQVSSKKAKEPHRVLPLVQLIIELLSTILLAAMTAVLSYQLGGAPSVLLLLVFVAVVLWQAGAVVLGVAGLFDAKKADPAPSAPPKPLLARYGGRPVMVLPSVREMRLAARREKKAW